MALALQEIVEVGRNEPFIFLANDLSLGYNTDMQPTITNHIEIRDNRRGEPRAFVAGTRIRVQDIVSDSERHGMTADEIAREYPHLSLAQVHASLAYYFDNRGEVQAALKADREFAAGMKKQLEKNSSTDVNGDSVSS